MKWRNMKAGERRKYVRNLEFNRTARSIGVATFCFARLLTPVLVLLGLTALAMYAQNTAHSNHLVLASSVGMIGGRDFLEVMKEGEALETSVGSRTSRIANFEEKLDKFINLIANTNGYSARKRRYMMEEAETTSDFPILFGTVLERQLLAKYAIADADWKTYVKTGTQRDFRVNNLIGIYGLESALSKVPERGEYKADKLQEGKIPNQLFKYGRQFPLSWEALINDDLGAFADAAQRLANSAMATENYEATKLLFDANGPNALLVGDALAHPIDATVLDNKTTAVFSADALADGVTYLRSQVDPNGNPILVTRFHLIHGPALEIPVLKALSPGSLIAGGATGVAVVTSENVVAKLPITPHVNPYVPLVKTANPTKNAWLLVAENAGGTPAVQMNFLRGHETPEVVQKVSNKQSLGGAAVSSMEGDFESDTQAWRIRHILGGTQVDPRFAYGSDGTA